MPRISPTDPVVAPVVTGESTPAADGAEPGSAEATPQVADKPFLVYVEDPAGPGERFDAIEKVLLQDERVAWGARAFTAVRMSADDAAADPLLARGGKAAPRFVIVAADYSAATTLEGATLSAGSVWNAMRTTSDRWYSKTLEACFKEFRDVLIELDKLDGERKTLEDKKTRVAQKGTEAEQQAVEAKLADLEVRRAKLTERQQAVFELKRKASKTKAA